MLNRYFSGSCLVLLSSLCFSAEMPPKAIYTENESCLYTFIDDQTFVTCDKSQPVILELYLKETKKFQESLKAHRELERAFKEQERALERKYADMAKAQTEASDAQLIASDPKLWACVKKRLPSGTPLAGTNFSLIDACLDRQTQKKK